MSREGAQVLHSFSVSEPYIHETAEVDPTAIVGPGTRIWHVAQVAGHAKIGRNCSIGKGVYIDRGVSIGDNVKIQNSVSVYRGVIVEDNVFLGPHMVFTNDKYPRSYNEDFRVLSTLVKRGASIGANATIVCGHTIGQYAMVGAGALVVSDVPPHGLVYGVPARLHGYVCWCGRKSKVVEQGDTLVLACASCKSMIKVEEGSTSG